MDKRYSQMTPHELQTEIAGLTEKARKAEQMGIVNELAVLERKITMAKAYMLNPEDFRPGGVLKHASIGIYAVIIFIGLFIAWLLSIAGMMIKHANFKIKKKEHELVITRGIIEKHQVTIPLRKIQAIKMKENVIRQLFGYATVAIVSAGSAGNEKEGAQTILFPIIRKSKLGVMLNGFTPDYVLEENRNHLPKRALRRYLFRSIIFSVFVIIPLCILFKPWGYASLLVLPVVPIRQMHKYTKASSIVKTANSAASMFLKYWLSTIRIAIIAIMTYLKFLFRLE